MAKTTLSAREARRITLTAQGLAGKAPTTVGPNRLSNLIDRLGVVQIDSVNVLTRSHYLPAFSRLGVYDPGLLESAAWGKRPSLFEYWGHEASLMPVGLQPLFRWRMARAAAGETWTGLARFGRERRDYIDTVLRRIESEGPLTGGDFAEGPRRAGWWNWSHGKQALEWLFWTGRITTRTRRGFERVYDLTERVLPAAIVNAPTPPENEAIRSLLGIAAGALGVATAADLRDYFRLPAAGLGERLAELAEAGDIIPVSVESWRQQAYLARDARAGRPRAGATLLSPFDNLIWTRDRAERLFGVRIRLEIYTPAHKREHGYYVLPMLVGESIAARVDLKADRAAGVLMIQAAHLENGSPTEITASHLASALTRMAAWQGLGEIRVADRGGLAQALRSAIGGAAAGSEG